MTLIEEANKFAANRTQPLITDGKMQVDPVYLHYLLTLAYLDGYNSATLAAIQQRLTK